MNLKISVLLLSLFIAPLCVAANAEAPCPRFDAGSLLQQPEDLYSANGVLDVRLSYRTRMDSSGNTLYCFVTENGAQSPTLHVYPGDRLSIHLKNELTPNGSTPTTQAMPQMAIMGSASEVCGSM
jgi:hypothetical protein